MAKNLLLITKNDYVRFPINGGVSLDVNFNNGSTETYDLTAPSVPKLNVFISSTLVGITGPENAIISLEVDSVPLDINSIEFFGSAVYDEPDTSTNNLIAHRIGEFG